MRRDACSEPSPARLALCRALNPQLQELWHSRGWDLEAQLPAFALSPCPQQDLGRPGCSPGAPLSLGTHSTLPWNTSGELWSAHSQQRSSPGADVGPT